MDNSINIFNKGLSKQIPWKVIKFLYDNGDDWWRGYVSYCDRNNGTVTTLNRKHVAHIFRLFKFIKNKNMLGCRENKVDEVSMATRITEKKLFASNLENNNIRYVALFSC